MTYMQVWTKENILQAIRAEDAHGHELSYSRTEQRVPSLIRAAERYFGSWGAAVNAAGFDYETIRRYRKWSRERILARIQDWYAKDADLSWRHVSQQLDPPLAAAVLHGNRFASWSEALLAAGLAPEEITRYRAWSLPAVHRELAQLQAQQLLLTQQNLQRLGHGALLAAVYRHGNGLNAERDALSKSTADKRKAYA